MSVAAPDVFHYLDYRQFLRDWFHHFKTYRRGFSHRWLARKAGLASPSYVKYVIEGKRNIKPATAQRLGQACGLAGESGLYFETLVAFTQAPDSEAKSAQYAKILSFRGYRQAHALDATHAEYYANWYVPAIYGLAARDDFSNDPVWIASTLIPPITPAKAARALDVLIALGLLAQENGQWKKAHAVLSTGAETRGVHIVNFHREMLTRASESIDLVARELRDISSLTLSLGPADIELIKARIQAFRKELLDYAAAVPSPDRVVQVNFQLFPLTQGKDS